MSINRAMESGEARRASPREGWERRTYNNTMATTRSAISIIKVPSAARTLTDFGFDHADLRLKLSHRVDPIAELSMNRAVEVPPMASETFLTDVPEYLRQVTPQQSPIAGLLRHIGPTVLKSADW